MGYRLATIEMDRRGERCYAPFGGGRVSPHLTQCDWAEAYLRTKWHLDPSSRLATIDMGQKVGGTNTGRKLGVWVGLCPLFGGELGPHLTQSGLGRGLAPYQVAS